MKISKSFLFGVVASVLALTAPVLHADLVVGSDPQVPETITDVVLSPWGTESFAISTTMSPTTCSTTSGWVIFALSNMSSQEAYDRAYSLVLSAMSANQPIIVDAHNGADCTQAYMIGVGSVTY